MWCAVVVENRNGGMCELAGWRRVAVNGQRHFAVLLLANTGLSYFSSLRETEIKKI